MNPLRFHLAALLLCALSLSARAQAGYTHVDLQAGYELFPDMSSKSGYNLNIGTRYALNDKYFIAATLHAGINNGTYEGIYAGEPTQLDHTLREYMLGIGPGLYLYNGGDRWLYADLLAGYGFGEELKSSSDSQRTTLNGFASALRIGAEYQLKAGHIIGICAAAYLTGQQLRPAINLKYGLFLNL